MEGFTTDGSTSSLNLFPLLGQIEAAAFDMDAGFYVQEALDAGYDYRYFDNSPMAEADGLSYEEDESPLFLPCLSPHHMESPLNEPAVMMALSTSLDPDEPRRLGAVRPYVYLSCGSQLEDEIQQMVDEFSLNKEQALAFSIVARLPCRRHQMVATSRFDSQPQLLMGLFGEGGTGKTRVINAIRMWFEVRGIPNELLITATTGAAVGQIGGHTLHSAIGLRKDGKVGRVSKKVMDLWVNREYLIVDEVSMMDARLLNDLHTQLGKLKSDPDSDFGGVSILFAGDFWQLPCISHMDIYISDSMNERVQKAHIRWRKLNAVVILKRQMRQAEDQ